MYTAGTQAASVTFNLDYEFSGAQQPQGTAPWATATIDDSFGGPNTVRLTMSTGGLVGSEFVSGWYFNFDPALDPTLLTFTAIDAADSTPDSVQTGVNAYKADGDGFYDILFAFPPPPGNDPVKFTAGEQVVYDISYVAPISASSFDFFSSPGGGAGVYRSAAHIQSIADPNYCDGSTPDLSGACGSGWIGDGGEPPSAAVPVPAAVWLFGSGLLGLVGVARRKAA
jgi:hypothetical protein